jgi:hypothetical protein
MLVIVGLTLATSGHVFADLLQEATKQRIGNYDVEMTTEPKSPTVSDTPTNILIRIAGVNGDHPADVPIMMRLVKDGVVLQTTNPIIYLLDIIFTNLSSQKQGDTCYMLT